MHEREISSCKLLEAVENKYLLEVLQIQYFGFEDSLNDYMKVHKTAFKIIIQVLVLKQIGF